MTYGEAYSDLSPDRLTQVIARKALSACLASDDFEVMELRRLDTGDGKVSDIIVVDCINDQVPSRNPFGIKARERLALVFTPDKPPEVRALRKDFPVLMHLNHVPPGEPASLCLYFEPWSAVERTWTPQKHLQRILWWLAETAKGSLHRADQPIERLYFDSPYEIVLPPDFQEKIKNKSLCLTFTPIEHSQGKIKAIIGQFQPKEEAKSCKLPQTELLQIELSPLVHGSVEQHPNTLGQLHDQFEDRGVAFLAEINSLIREKATPYGLTRDPLGRCLLIFSIPIKRSVNVEPESTEVRAFLLFADIATLGEATGALMPLDSKLYATQLIGEATPQVHETWRDQEVFPVDVKFKADKAFARKASDVPEDTGAFKGVLAGVGALGSALAELWSRESWGDWTFIDFDIVKAHNIVRHAAKDFHIGKFKVDAVKEIVELNYHDHYYAVEAIPDSAMNWENGRVKDTITSAALLVDATTTLEVPRELSQRDAPRSVSVFLTPSGHSSVLILESSDRRLRLDSLEAQYYRAIINSDWGKHHLDGNDSSLWVGAGCRDVSAIISNESVQLHAATIARRVRLLRDQPEAKIQLWTVEIETGAIVAQDVPVSVAQHTKAGEWQVIWDTGFKKKICTMRHAQLPSETGGVILGYIDQKLKAIYVVDALPAPPDSEADRTGFTRGIEGLEAALYEVARRTAKVVNYIGEWHSHPEFAYANPSSIDRELIIKLANTLAKDGQPTLMVIVGSAGDISITVKDG